MLGFLETMRKERREDHIELTRKVEEGFKDSSAWSHTHELADQARFLGLDKRLGSLEALGHNMKWGVRTGIGVVGVFIVDLLKNHLPKWF